jgi:hypothetical protein
MFVKSFIFQLQLEKSHQAEMAANTKNINVVLGRVFNFRVGRFVAVG